jgi:Holliday junction resolvase RusA-like endonuclease
MDPWTLFEQERRKFSVLNAEYDFGLRAQPKQRSHNGVTKMKTRNWEKLAYECAEEQAPEVVPTGRLGIEILFLSTKPVGDLDNCIKTFKDALNRCAYKDDRQIDFINALRVCGPEYTDRTLARVLERE